MSTGNQGGNMSISDGFKFGCGFIMAATVFYVGLAMLCGGLAFIVSLFGVVLALPSFNS